MVDMMVGYYLMGTFSARGNLSNGLLQVPARHAKKVSSRCVTMNKSTALREMEAVSSDQLALSASLLN